MYLLKVRGSGGRLVSTFGSQQDAWELKDIQVKGIKKILYLQVKVSDADL